MKKIIRILILVLFVFGFIGNYNNIFAIDNELGYEIENINYDNRTEMLSFEIFAKNGLQPGKLGTLHGNIELNKAYSQEIGMKAYTWRISNSQVTPIYFEHSGGNVKVGEMDDQGNIVFNNNIDGYKNVRLRVETKVLHQPLYNSLGSSLIYNSGLMIGDNSFGKFSVSRPSAIVKPYTNTQTTIHSFIFGENVAFTDYFYPQNFILRDKSKVHIKKFNENSKMKIGDKILSNGDTIVWNFLDSIHTKIDLNNDYSFSVLKSSASGVFNETETEFIIDLPSRSDAPKEYTHLMFNGIIIPGGEIPENIEFKISQYGNPQVNYTKRAIEEANSNANGSGNKFIDNGTQTDNPGMVDSSTDMEGMVNTADVSTDMEGMVNTGDINTQVDVTKVPINLSAKRNFESGITTISGEAEPGSIVYIVANGNNYNVTTSDEGKFIVELEKLQKGDKLIFTAQVGEKLESDENYTIVTEDKDNSSQTDNPGMVDSSTDTNDIPKNNKDTGTQTDDIPGSNNKNNTPPALTTPSAEIPQINDNKSNRKLPKTGTAGLAAVSSINDKKGKENSKKLVNKAENKNQSKNDNPESSSPYAADARQFITFETKNGKTFHLVINHDEKSENVMLLTEVSEDDLLNMAERKEPVKTEVKVEEQAKEVSKVPVKQEKKSELGTYLVIGLVAIVGAAGAYFFKKHKKEEADNLSQFEENDIDDNEVEEIDDIE